MKKHEMKIQVRLLRSVHELRGLIDGDGSWCFEAACPACPERRAKVERADKLLRELLPKDFPI